jgi:hypothetical protein
MEALFPSCISLFFLIIKMLLIKIYNIKNNKQKKIDETHQKIFDDFKSSFMNIHHREPLQNEIMDNLLGQIDNETLLKLTEKDGHIV